jgi:hypothetical protein
MLERSHSETNYLYDVTGDPVLSGNALIFQQRFNTPDEPNGHAQTLALFIYSTVCETDIPPLPISLSTHSEPKQLDNSTTMEGTSLAFRGEIHLPRALFNIQK